MDFNSSRSVNNDKFSTNIPWFRFHYAMIYYDVYEHCTSPKNFRLQYRPNHGCILFLNLNSIYTLWAIIKICFFGPPLPPAPARHDLTAGQPTSYYTTALYSVYSTLYNCTCVWQKPKRWGTWESSTISNVYIYSI